MNKKYIASSKTAVLFFFAVAVGAGNHFLASPHLNAAHAMTGARVAPVREEGSLRASPPASTNFNTFAFSDIRDPGGIPQGLPVRLQIPVIGVDSAIEDALITPDGRMDVPAGSVDVAWFALGPHPGQVGSAVIGGHYGIQNGVPFVFYNLDKLRVGDKIYVVDDKNDTLAFQVKSIASFDRNADATPVFISDDGLAHLNLITCEGIWNQVNGNYPDRLVIFADAIPAGSAGVAPVTPAPVASTTAAISAFTRSLTIGATGADVAALQTALGQKGFLTMPAGVAQGYFGALTRSAVAAYQISENLLPSVGFFGPLTRSRLTAELASGSFLPNTGTEPVVASSGPENQPAQAQTSTLVRSAQSLIATPMDIFITFLLLVLIVFTAYKIFRR